MLSALNYKINSTSIKATHAGIGQRRKPVPSHDRMANALNAVRNADSVKRYMQMYKAGELFTLDSNKN